MKIAYLMNSYPMTSTTFIRREVRALEQLGFEVTRIALRRWGNELVEAEDQIEQQRTRYVLHYGVAWLVLAVMRALLTRPVRLTRALALAWRMSRCADRPLPVHLAYLIEACCIEPWLRAASIRHVHAHFGTNSAEVAMLVACLGRATMELYRPRPRGIRQGTAHWTCRKDPAAVRSWSRSAPTDAASFTALAEQRHWPKVQVVHCGLDRSLL